MRRGERLARTLVEEGLAACVNLHAPMVSIYRWKGERRARVRTSGRHQDDARRLPALEARLKALHPYELPEFVVLEVEGGSAYLAGSENRSKRSQRSEMVPEVRSGPVGPVLVGPLGPVGPWDLLDLFLATSNTIGSSDTKTIPIVTSEKFCLTIGTLPKSSPAPRQSADPRRRRRRGCRARTRAASSAPRRPRTARTSARSARSGRG